MYSIYDPLLPQLLDQSLHVLWAMSVALFVAAYGGPRSACIAAAVILDCPREFVDQWPIRADSDFYVDLLFFGVGGWFAYELTRWRRRRESDKRSS